MLLGCSAKHFGKKRRAFPWSIRGTAIFYHRFDVKEGFLLLRLRLFFSTKFGNFCTLVFHQMIVCEAFSFIFFLKKNSDLIVSCLMYIL